MDLVGETTPLLGAEHVLDEEAAPLPTSPTHKKSFPRARQVAALMLITTVWPFSFEMIYPFINQVRFRALSSSQGLPNVDAEIVYHGNRSYRRPRECWILLWFGRKYLCCRTVVHQ